MKKPGRHAARSREEWVGLVSEWKTSGSTARAFASARGLSVSSLFYWSSTLKREAPTARAGSRLLPVRVTAAAPQHLTALELVVGGTRVRFDGGASPRYVAALAQALLEAAPA